MAPQARGRDPKHSAPLLPRGLLLPSSLVAACAALPKPATRATLTTILTNPSGGICPGQGRRPGEFHLALR
jgi:hypothetical protein